MTRNELRTHDGKEMLVSVDGTQWVTTLQHPAERDGVATLFQFRPTTTEPFNHWPTEHTLSDTEIALILEDGPRLFVPLNFTQQGIELPRRA